MQRWNWWIASFLLAASCQAAPAAAPAQQFPFICRAQEAGLGQPVVDSFDATAHPVLDSASHQPFGYSRQCAITPRIAYFYYTGSEFKPFKPATDYAHPPADMRRARYGDASVPFVVRVEVGTINRFFYTIAMLAPSPEPGAPAWNHKLFYWLRGGVGIGHQQGLPMWINGALSRSERQLLPPILEQGYAVLSSSGNETGVHYNMRLAGDTAAKLKQHFIASYGQPLYTIAMGGSGGAVQQYLFAQNLPGLFDAGVPIQSFPDMITQTIPISDCPLLGQYFKDAVAKDPASPWARWSSQTLVEGMNASDTVRNAQSGQPGTTECINGWRMAMPTVLNPLYRDHRFDLGAHAYGYPDGALDKVKWTHWNDLADIYGEDQHGYAPIPIDNVGVQYGLAALAAGQLDVDEFLRLNACVGTWKEQPDFVPWKGAADPFDSANMLRGERCRFPDGTPAPRRAGDLGAIRQAYTAGQVFTGQRLGIPMIDLRPYLEATLDMHNARQSFAVRARLQANNPAQAAQQVIWFVRPEADLVPVALEAVGVLDRYLAQHQAPPMFTDRCLDERGATIAAGPAVWDGVLDQRPAGACTQAFPLFSSARMVAGASIRGDTFKCALKPVASALADGTYPPGVHFSASQLDWLARIFPQGVCDYTRGDVGRPASW
ncbi:DUF6351 family protein [Rugamonas apoptosis]|uniref:DUF6351 domain-containing protein n=1 Tax=Rugamonas apoptosis TaxID=2758570 RepID=A0A7W2ILZ2_9BURK|nr:DUF6351 family protein [Rugamonas apoptosis]MBA5688966.1 hypothetical protein [Rugamonas apoptosis]